MAIIQTLEKENGTTIYPQTHLRAVIDSTGTTLENIHKTFVHLDSQEQNPGEVIVPYEETANKISIIANVTTQQYPTAQAVIDYVAQEISKISGGGGGGPITETDPTVPAWAKEPNKPTYTKIDIGLGNVDNVKQYSSSNPPPYPVTSVNGSTGAVNISIPSVPSWALAPSKPTYNKSDVGLDKVDNVKQYSSTNPPPYPVTSVNGNTGIVNLSIPTKTSEITNDSNFKHVVVSNNDISVDSPLAADTIVLIYQ